MRGVQEGLCPQGYMARGDPKRPIKGNVLTLWVSLGNIYEQGKERMLRQRLVLRWPQNLQGKGSGDGVSAQPQHELLAVLTACRGSSILSSHKYRLSRTGGLIQYGSHVSLQSA